MLARRLPTLFILFVTLFTPVLAAPARAAQGLTTFRPHRHLEAWEECRASDYADLYDLERFQALDGEAMDSARLEEVRRLWKEERARAAERIEAIEADPRELAIRALQRRIADHPYLSRTDTTRVDTYAPFVFFVERPRKDDPDYAGAMADFYGPWFQVLDEIFRKEFVEPLELERRPGTVLAVFMLASRGAYQDYATAMRLGGMHGVRAHYNPELEIAVTYRDAFGQELNKSATERQAALHELVHAMQHAYGVEGFLKNPWLAEGFAEYLSCHDQVMPGVLREHRPDAEALATLAAMTQVRELERALLFPLEELLGLPDYGAVVEAAAERARLQSIGLPEFAGVALEVFYAQSSLWMHFLRHGENGRYREAFGRLVGRVQRGEAVAAAFRASFEGVGLDELDRGYRRHVNAELEKHPRLRGRVSSKPFRRRGPRGAPTAASAPASSAPPAPAAAFDPARLEPDAGDPEVALALALGEASRGAYGAARERLQAHVTCEQEALRARIEREVERLDGMIALRRRFLEHLQAKGRKLKLLRFEGKRNLLARIVKLEEDRVKLGKNSLGLRELRLDEIPPCKLAKQMQERKVGFEQHALIAYPYLLAGDPEWERVLDDAEVGKERSGLGADAAADYSERLVVAADALLLRELARAGVPEAAVEAQATFEAAAALAKSETALVQDRFDDIVLLGRKCLERAFDEGGLGQCLEGEVEELAGGRVRLTYAFDRAEELEDFVSGCEVPYAGNQVRSQYAFSGRGIRAAGKACMRHVLEFEGEQTVRWTQRFGEPPGGGTIYFVYGVFLNVTEAGRAGLSSEGLQAEDARLRHADSAPVNLGDPWKRMTLELRYDGSERIELRAGRKPRGSVATGSHGSGTVEIHSSASTFFQIEHLVIEGRVREESLRALRDDWVRERLAEAELR